MTGPILLDMSRAVARRWKGATPSGIDRVCDAYAVHFGYSAHAVLQIRGRMRVLDRRASRLLFSALDLPTKRFRHKLLSVLARPGMRRDDGDLAGGIYLNVGHSDFDLTAHWDALQANDIRRIYMLHDLIPITHPEVTTPHKTARHRGRVMNALRNADGIMVNSRATSAELTAFAQAKRLPLPPCLANPIAGAGLPVPLRPPVFDRPTLVSVGTIEARKNHMLLLKVWSALIDRLGEAVPMLVLAGSLGLRSEPVRAALEKDARLRRHVKIRSGLDDSELAALMVGSRGVLLPTLAEGYGLPMVEALRLRVPVIASDLPSFREFGQGIPVLLDPSDVEAWVGAIISLLDEGEARQRQVAAMEHFRPVTWPGHFTRLERWLENTSATMQDDADGAAASGDGTIATETQFARALR